MIVYFVCVSFLLVQQSYCSTEEPQSAQEQGADSLGTRGNRVIRIIYQKVNPYPDVKYDLPKSSPETASKYLPRENDSDAGGDANSKLAQHLIFSLENDLLRLHSKIGSELNENILLQIIIRVDQKLARLNSLNGQNLPSKIRYKIGKLKQNVGDVKLTILSLAKENGILYEHLQNGGKHVSKSYKSTAQFKEWVNNLRNVLDGLKQSHLPESNQKALQRIEMLVKKVSALLGKAGLTDLPSSLQNAIKHFQISVHVFLNKIPLVDQEISKTEKGTEIENEYSGNMEEELKRILDILRQEIDSSHQNLPNTFGEGALHQTPGKNHWSEFDTQKSKLGEKEDSLRTVQERIKHLEDYLTALEAHDVSKLDEWSVSQLKIMINTILVELEKTNKMSIPQELLNKVNKLEKKIDDILKTFPKLKDLQEEEGQDSKNIMEKTAPHNNAIHYGNVINSLENRFNQLRNKMNSKPNGSIIMQVFVPIDNMLKELALLEKAELHPESLKSKIDTLQQNIKKFKNEMMLLMSGQIQKKNNSVKGIQDWVNVLEDYLAQLESHNTAPKMNKYAIFDINIHFQSILTEVKRIGLQNVPEELANKIKLLKEKIKSIMAITLGEKGEEDNGNIKIDINDKDIEIEVGSEKKILEDWILSMEEYLENLDIQLMSQQFDASKVSQLIFEADNILNQIKQVNLNTISEELKNRVQKLIYNLTNYKNEVNSMGNKKISESKNPGKVVEITTQHVNSLERYFERLKSQVDPKQGLVILTHTNAHIFEILNDLKQLRRIENLPTNLRNKIIDLQKNVTSFKDKLISLIAKLKPIKMIEKETPSPLSNESNYEIMKELVLSIQKELENLNKRLINEQDELKLMNINIEAHQLLIKLQKLANKSVPDNLLGKIKKLERRVENMIVEIDLIISENRNDNENKDFDRDVKDADDSFIAVIEEELIGYEHELENIRKQLAVAPDLQTIVHLYNQIHTILLDLQKLNFKDMPENIVIKINNVLQNSTDLKDKIENAVTNFQLPKDETVGNNLISKSPKDRTTESQVQRLYRTLNYLRERLVSNVDRASLTSIYIEINKILLDLEQLELKELPGRLLTKIKELIQFTKAFRDKVEPLLQKQVESKDTAYEDGYTELENIIKERINSFVAILQILNQAYLLGQDQSSLIRMHNKVEQILEELQHLLTHNIRQSLKTKIKTIQDEASKFKLSVESKIKSKILKPMEIYIDELLLELETLRQSKWNCCSHRKTAKIFSLETDLKLLKADIHSLTDYDLIRQLHYRIEAVVAKLDDLKGYYRKPGLVDRAVNKLGKFLRDIL